MIKIVTYFNYYKERLDSFSEEFKKLPTGHLVKRKNLYWHVINKKEVGITKNADLIQKLCRKKYIMTSKRKLKKNISILSYPISKLDIATREEIIRSLPKSYQGVPKSYFYHSSIKDWLAEPYQKNPMPIKDGIKSEKGMIFRTKSEFMIASVLDKYDIPYRYEAAFTLDGQTKYPDFIIKHPYTGELIIWEHFGGLHYPGYMQKMWDKVNLYMKHGYIPFKNLICTFEDEVKDISRLHRFVENLILGE